MKLWMSGELQSDAAESYRRARNLIEPEVNRLLAESPPGEKIAEWAFIAIIREEDHPDYDEVVRKSSRGRSLEFRLKIKHKDFVSASSRGQLLLILGALSRSVHLMTDLGVPRETQSVLEAILARTADELVHQSQEGATRTQ